MAGALAQLVQLDSDAAVKALLSLLSCPELRHQMGQSALSRANELFAEEVVMNQYQELFAELHQRRLGAPAEARKGKPVPASLDPVRAFKSYPSHISSEGKPAINSISNLPKALCDGRASLWKLLDESTPAHLKHNLQQDLLRKHSFHS